MQLDQTIRLFGTASLQKSLILRGFISDWPYKNLIAILIFKFLSSSMLSYSE